MNFNLVVIDNEPSLKTKKIVEDLELFRYVKECNKGFAFARNRILDYARGSDFVVMIDDDMRLSDDWLKGVLHSINSNEAQIYSSDVFPDNVSRIPLSLRRFFIRPNRLVGRTTPNFGSGNVVLDMNFIESNSISFNLRFNKHGGEDVDFFNLMSSHGALAKWVSNFPVYENYVDSQLTFRAVAKREFRTAKSFEKLLSDYSMRHRFYLFARIVEVAVLDWASLKIAFASSENLYLKIKVYFYHKMINLVKIFARLSAAFKRP